MNDLPAGPALLALAREVLLRDLLPLLPQAVHLDARLIANSIAIAEREAVSGEPPAMRVRDGLKRLYCGKGEEKTGLLSRFAQDLRRGSFETSEPQDREAREIMWRLTIAKLRNANPRSLSANGFS